MLEYRFNNYIYRFNEKTNTEKDAFIIITDKHKTIPDSFYKYYALNDYSVDSLINHYLYASHPWELNDPFDCYRSLISFEKASLEDLLNLNSILKKDFFPREDIIKFFSSSDPVDRFMLDDIFTKHFFAILYSKIGLFSVTTKNNSMEMWTYYTNHKGFVLKFSLDLLPQNYMGPFPINYTNNFEKIDYNILKTGSILYQTNLKAECWVTENEWRLLYYNDDPMKFPHYDSPNSHNRKFYYNPNAISEVILGLKFFDLHEYDFDNSTAKEQIVKLKTNKKRKRKTLKYLLSKKYKLSMINYKKESISDLASQPIEIEQISTNKYKIKYVG